ncbi:CrcB family protein [Lysinibacter sp. HNR]|uniref:fluoride efflux transporter FluC n=1 Tax=Lysinibacter sp. HNR TaxID=3031408 RepID=UPI002435534B|nr:CrcB family protein [Lysinibacter sp. HNR]WGD38558.1 CrcB family protein [Lysinibacter sp. HNR]
MTPVLLLLAGVMGGLGVGLRFLCDTAIRLHLKTSFSWATTLINTSGSLALGVLTGLVLTQVASEELRIVLGSGFLGGYTTFSTASYETVQYIRQKRYGFAVLSGAGMLLLCVGAAALGLWITTFFAQ